MVIANIIFTVATSKLEDKRKVSGENNRKQSESE